MPRARNLALFASILQAVPFLSNLPRQSLGATTTVNTYVSLRRFSYAFSSSGCCPSAMAAAAIDN